MLQWRSFVLSFCLYSLSDTTFIAGDGINKRKPFMVCVSTIPIIVYVIELREVVLLFVIIIIMIAFNLIISNVKIRFHFFLRSTMNIVIHSFQAPYDSVDWRVLTLTDVTSISFLVKLHVHHGIFQMLSTSNTPFQYLYVFTGKNIYQRFFFHENGRFHDMSTLYILQFQ